jgi:O-methyltransferase
MKVTLEKILKFHNTKLDPTIIDEKNISTLVEGLLTVIESNTEGDVVELGCYVGESSKYLMKTLLETKSTKKLYLYDSFEGLPPLSKWEENTGWRAGTLKTTRDVLETNFSDNNLPIPFTYRSWFKDIPEQAFPEKIAFAFLDGDFYDSIYDSLDKIFDKVVDGGHIYFHDYKRNDLPGVEAAIIDYFNSRGLENTVIEVIENLGMYIKPTGIPKLEKNYELIVSENVTIVTGLWNMGRGELENEFSRSYDHYKEKFVKLLKSPAKMFIYVSKEDEEFVWQYRSKKNTYVKIMELPEFDTWFEFFNKVQGIRNKPEWYNQASWLQNSPQAKLKYYNPVVMSKIFLLNNATLFNPFQTENFFWIDAGITNTVHPGYFIHDKVFDKLPTFIDAVNKFVFLSYPYEGSNEIHGFPRTEMARHCNTDYVRYVCRGGFFGGKKTDINNINSLYYNILYNTLQEGNMGTEESIFTILAHKYHEFIYRFEIGGDGMIWPFFEKLKNIDDFVKQLPPPPLTVDSAKNNLYILTFNSTVQFESVAKSIRTYDATLFDRSRKILINNSTDESLFGEYDKLCNEYGFEEIHRENLGVSGGRQFAAEHFDGTDADFYMFFEDDMHFAEEKDGVVCRNGFMRRIDNFYTKLLKIIIKEKFDFLKFSFSEFFGENNVQWAWYNVPQEVRTKYWPNYDKLPQHGLDPNAPRVEFKNIEISDGIPYVTGDIYYSNWPQIVTREGNTKMFLNTTWAYPTEQTWMSHMYQLGKENKLRAAILLASPIEHNRFDFYEGNLRKES